MVLRKLLSWDETPLRYLWRIFVFGWVVAATPLLAQELDHKAEYQACLAETRLDPEEAFEQALAWASLGGGDAAEHCAALALMNLGQLEQAAFRLERLGRATRKEPPVKAGLFAHAGQAWLLAGEAERATQAFSAAVTLDPTLAPAYAGRGEAWALRGDYRGAHNDLSTALSLDPGQADVFALRASARRHLKRLNDALLDASTALKLVQDHPEALLERGIIYRLRGADDQARADWLTLVRTSPDSEAAEAARRNLELLDVKVETTSPVPLR